jgi:hypothetical protein
MLAEGMRLRHDYITHEITQHYGLQGTGTQQDHAYKEDSSLLSAQGRKQEAKLS